MTPSAPEPACWSRVTIVGLGLLGGSLALALQRQFPSIEVVAVDRSEVLGSSAARRISDRQIVDAEAEAVERVFAQSDLVFLAAPIRGIAHWLPRALEYGARVTDCGSTKAELVEVALGCAAGDRFVPGHPMAGSSGGLESASPDLFCSQPWILCPEGVRADPFQGVRLLVEALGAKPVLMGAKEHDRAVAWTSHAPRLIASALATLAQGAGAFPAAGPAFERVVRGAGGAPAVWADILDTNREPIAAALRAVVARLEDCAQGLEGEATGEPALDLLRAGQAASERFRS